MPSRTAARVRAQRLAAQCLSRPAKTVASATRRLLGVQAQDLNQAGWALAVRSAGASRESVAAAFASREIVRTWCMRGTLHIVAAEDLAWLVRLLGPRNLARAAGRLRQLGIGERDIAKARAVAEKRLLSGPLSRTELFARFEAAGQQVRAQRGVHLLFCLSQLGVLCQVGEDFVLAAECSGQRAVEFTADEALGELARRYGAGHGPASAADLAFWAGLGNREAKRALEIAGRLEPATAVTPKAMLLPGYDEYLLGYADRSACIDPQHAKLVVPGGNGVYQPMVVIGGTVRATWRRVQAAGRTRVIVRPFPGVRADWSSALEAAVRGLSVFLAEKVALELDV